MVVGDARWLVMDLSLVHGWRCSGRRRSRGSPQLLQRGHQRLLQGGSAAQPALTDPSRLTTRMGHGEVALPHGAAATVTERARPLQGVTAALAAVQGDVLLAPRHSACKAGVELGAQLLDREDRVLVLGMRALQTVVHAPAQAVAG